MYYIGPGAVAELGLGRVRFQPAVVIAPLVCRPIWPGPIADTLAILGGGKYPPLVQGTPVSKAHPPFGPHFFALPFWVYKVIRA